MAMPQERLNHKTISEKTLEEVRKLDILSFAELLGDSLRRNGQWYMTYKNGGERTPSVGIHPGKNIWEDFTRTGIRGNDVLSYYAYRMYDDISLKGPRFLNTVMNICQIAGIPLIYSDGQVVEPTGERRVHEAKLQTNTGHDPKADDLTLDRYYRAMFTVLPLLAHHKKHLLEERGLSEREIEARQYRSLSDNRRNRYQVAREVTHLCGGAPEGIPGFGLFEGNYGPYWTVAGRNGFLIPFRSIENRVVGFQLRVDNPVIIRAIGPLKVVLNDGKVEIYHSKKGDLLWKGLREALPHLKLEEGKVFIESAPKYVWLSTNSDKERGILKGAQIGYPRPAPYHCAVPSSVLRVWEPGEPLSNYMDTKTVWWGEGPLKGDISSEFTDQVHLQVAGVKNFELLFEPTAQLEAEEIIIAFDADAQTKSKDVGESVVKCVERAREVFGSKGVRLRFAAWNPNQAKGLDDLFALHVRPQLLDL